MEHQQMSAGAVKKMEKLSEQKHSKGESTYCGGRVVLFIIIIIIKYVSLIMALVRQ